MTAAPRRAALSAAAFSAVPVLAVVALALAAAAGCAPDAPSDAAADAAADADPGAPAADADADAGAEAGADGDGETGGETGGEDADAAAGDPAAPPALESVRIFFPSAGGNGLVGETREIFETSTPGDRIKQIVADLLSGPRARGALAAVPKGTALRQAYVAPDGTAYLDFSPELADGLGGGSLQEMLTVYAIVDSVVLNVREVQRVVLLISGRPVDTLNGHMDLRRPIPADRSWIL